MRTISYSVNGGGVFLFLAGLLGSARWSGGGRRSVSRMMNVIVAY